MSTIQIGNRVVGPEHPPYFIADIAANHDGDIERAFRLIELAKEAGADAAKFQNFSAKNIVSENGFASMNRQLSHQKGWDKSVFEVYEDASVPDEWSFRLKEHCDSVGIEYMTSPYDFGQVDLADQYSSCFKIGSGDITWIEILRYIAEKGKPVILATGASSMMDVKRAIAAISSLNDQIILMQCNTNYTGSEENFRHINLNVLTTYHQEFPGVILGLSDHTFGYETVLGAIALGARVVEKHFTDDNSRCGPDHKFSMNPKSWRDMVLSANRLFLALGSGVKQVEENERDTVIVQRRALYYVRDMEKGTVIQSSDIFPVRPIQDGELPPYHIDEVIGRTLVKSVGADTSVKWEDFK